MASVACRCVQDKSAALKLLDQQVVEEICRQKGYRWREVKLPPGRTAACFGWQVLMGNVPCDAVAHHEDGDFTGEAYCMARQRLPDSPQVRKHFGCSGKQKPGCGYPTAHVLLLCGPGGVAVDAICSPLRTGDMTHAAQTHKHLQEGDLLMGDRLFGGWGHLHVLQSQKLDGLFPAHHTRKIGWGAKAECGQSRRFVRSLGYYDQLVQYRKPRQRPKWMTAEQFASAPQWITVREVRRRVWVGGVRRLVTLVTTLSDAGKYPAKQLVKLLGKRWTIELNLRSLKTAMGLEKLRCRSIQGIKKELAMYLIVYNLVRLRMLKAAARQRVPLARISFTDALDCLRYGRVEDVKLQVNPERPGRAEPRSVKSRGKAFPKMTKPRPQLRRELKTRRKAVALA